MPTDVTDAASVERLAATAFEEHGGVHLLCNNAGVFSGGFLWERTIADWEWVMAVNVYGIVHAIRSFVPRMLAAAETRPASSTRRRWVGSSPTRTPGRTTRRS